MGEVSIYLADGTVHVRQAIRLTLEHQKDLMLTGEAGHVEGLLAKICQEPPDVLLLDWDLPGMHPHRTLTVIRENCPGTSIIGTGVRQEQSKTALAHGIVGFLYKGVPPEDFVSNLYRLLEMSNILKGENQ